MGSLVGLSKITVPRNIRAFDGVEAEDLAKVPLSDFPTEFQDYIKDLASSIEEHGLINPITVKDLGEGKKYRLIAGFCRFKAAQYIGLKQIDVKSIKGKTDDESILQLVENIHRKDMNPLDVAQALHGIMKIKGVTKQSDLAEMVRMSKSWVSQHLSLLDASVDVQISVRNGEMSLAAAKIVSSAIPKEKQGKAVEKAKKEAKKAGKKKVTVKSAKKQAREQEENEAGRQLAIRPIEERENEQRDVLVRDFLSAEFGETLEKDEFDKVGTLVKRFWSFLMKRGRIVIK